MLARVVFGSILQSQVELAIRRYERTQREFAAAISLSGSNPGRPRRIKRAAEIEASARNELWHALERLDNFNMTGWVPRTPVNGSELVRQGIAP